MRIMLRKNNRDVKANEAEKYEFVMKIAAGKSGFEEIKQWIENKIIELVGH